MQYVNQVFDHESSGSWAIRRIADDEAVNSGCFFAEEVYKKFRIEGGKIKPEHSLLKILAYSR